MAERRAAIAAWTKNDTPPALGPVPEIIDDPAIVMLWGITRESLDAWLDAESGEAKRDIEGLCRIARRGRRHGARGEVRRKKSPACAMATSWCCQVDQPHLVADLPQDRRRGVRTSAAR